MYKPPHELTLIFQTTWIHKSVIKCLEQHARFGSAEIARNFIHHLHKKHVRETPIVRIYQYLKTTPSRSLTAIVSDATHLILALFPYEPTVVKYEQHYRHRLTYMTEGCLFHITKANLRFATAQEVLDDFDYSISSNIQVVVMEIQDFKVFLRDQAILPYEAIANVKMIYYDRDYYDLCGPKPVFGKPAIDAEGLVCEDYGDVVSV